MDIRTRSIEFGKDGRTRLVTRDKFGRFVDTVSLDRFAESLDIEKGKVTYSYR